MIGNGRAGINQFGVNVILDVFNNRVFNHEIFGISKRFDIAASEVIDIILDTTLFDKDQLVLLPVSVSGFDAGPLNVDLYIGTTYTVGTTWPGTDRNLVDPVTPKSFGKYKPTITVLGTKSEVEFFVPSNGVAAVAKLAGATKEDLIIKLAPGTTYHFRITNTTASTGQGLFAANWFEV